MGGIAANTTWAALPQTVYIGGIAAKCVRGRHCRLKKENIQKQGIRTRAALPLNAHVGGIAAKCSSGIAAATSLTIHHHSSPHITIHHASSSIIIHHHPSSFIIVVRQCRHFRTWVVLLLIVYVGDGAANRTRDIAARSPLAIHYQSSSLIIIHHHPSSSHFTIAHHHRAAFPLSDWTALPRTSHVGGTAAKGVRGRHCR